MSGPTISILEGNTFAVSDRRGDIDSSPTEPHGLFDADTRFLSRWVLTIDGKRPTSLSTDDVEYFLAQFFLAPTSGTIYVDADLSVMRSRSIHRGFHEEIRIHAEPARLVLGYRRETWVRETWISATNGPVFDEQGLTFQVHLAPHGEWTTAIEVQAVPIVRGKILAAESREAVPEAKRHAELERVLEVVPQLTSNWLPLVETYQRAVVDLAALRFYPAIAPGEAMLAAGLPWFMAV